MKTDNPAHKALFTIPAAIHSTAIATVKPLPPQRKITGHKQTDAYLWVLDVIKTNEPAHLAAAEEALEKLTITPKEAQERYSQHLIKSGLAPFQIAFGTMNLDNPHGYIKGAKRAIEEASQVRATFGTYEAAMENTEAENLMLAGEVGELYSGQYFWNEKEKTEGCMYGDRVTETEKLRKDLVKGFAESLPEPATLSDVVREYQYWHWLYEMRSVAYQELYSDYYHGSDTWIYDREDYLEEKLVTIQPVSREEAVNVCKWLLDNERFDDRSDITSRIILNLVGECG